MNTKLLTTAAVSLALVGTVAAQGNEGQLPAVPATQTLSTTATAFVRTPQTGAKQVAEIVGTIKGVVGTVVPGTTGEWPNPVPTHVDTRYYGYRANLEPPLRVKIWPYEYDRTTMRVDGGNPGTGAVLFCSAAPDAIPTICGMLLVTPNCVVIPGVFDAEGCFDVPINPGQKTLCGSSFYFQAMEVSNLPSAMKLSWGLEVTYREGNAQPRNLTYHRPAMQAIPCRTVLEEIPILHTVLVRFEAAQSYVLTLDGIVYQAAKDTTKIFVSLTSPGGPVGKNQWHCVGVDVAKRDPPARAEVWVALDHGSGKTYELGAVVHFDFGTNQ